MCEHITLHDVEARRLTWVTHAVETCQLTPLSLY